VIESVQAVERSVANLTHSDRTIRGKVRRTSSAGGLPSEDVAAGDVRMPVLFRAVQRDTCARSADRLIAWLVAWLVASVVGWPAA
jgi:hypothetical protein